MDKQTRNLIQRATQDARRLMEKELSEQMEGIFDVLSDGTILPEPSPHLDDRQRVIRQKIIAAIAHKASTGRTNAEAVADYTREAAVTFLNRFVALKMLEARGLVQECISKGDQSSGFKEFCGLAPGLSSLPDHGYRLYLECLFDELSTEVNVLFDRQDAASLLWPRRQALLELLEILTRPELAGVWGEDETIGWVYQYFNSDEERRKMREESAAPRNSRELAVRNQFFTPRYVVEFLTDNTLGRTWYEMRQGDTRIKDACRYLVQRPTEIFLKEGEEPPEDSEPGEDLSREELLKQPVYIPYRPKKDPREIRILDPACGSGHFLLYCFDLLEIIYEEAWTDPDLGPALWKDLHWAPPTPDKETQPLADEALSLLRRDVPGLILRHNLHGIDIDPRAIQIAALALWLRAQRSYQRLGLKGADRPKITRSNLVCAEPMPGEQDLFEEFVATLKPDVLGDLVRVVWDRMKLAGEAGSLLKIEEELRGAIAEARKQWLARPKAEQLALWPERRRPRAEQLALFDVSEITDEEFWDEAEARVLDALQDYARRVSNGKGLSRQLFADDAVQGFSFIDVCRKRFDVVLMNPPFGKPSQPSKAHVERSYPRTKNDVYVAFVERCLGQLVPGGMLGIISSRTGFFLFSFQKWREEVLLKEARPTVFADLGYGVLDTAMVETAAYCLVKDAHET